MLAHPCGSHHARPRLVRTTAATILVSLSAHDAMALDIHGMLPMSLDLPRLNIILSPTANPENALIFTDALGNPVQNFTAFADTGASGLLLDGAVMQALMVDNPGLSLLQTVNGSPVKFYDVGVGGSEVFDVSQGLHIGVARNPLGGDPDTGQVDPSEYDVTPVPLRLQVSQAGGAGSMMGSDPLNVFGMPILARKVLVIDNRPINAAAPLVSNMMDLLSAALGGEDLLGAILGGGDTGPAMDLALHTSLHHPGDAAIPTTNRHVKLSYASFTDFTFTEPDEAEGGQRPAMEANPFVGWNPIEGKQAGDPAGVTIQRSGQVPVEGSFLLDTGASISMISSQIAQALGVLVTESGLVYADSGLPVEGQFNTAIGGVGGSKKVYGLVVDALTLPTVEGDPIRFINAPVYVADISVQRTLQGGQSQIITLDGILGMNLLSAGANLNSDVLGFDPTDFMTALGQSEWDVMNDPFGSPLFDNPDALMDDLLNNLNFLLAFAGALTQGIPTIESPFSWIVVDNHTGVLGLQVIPEPMSLGCVLVLGCGLLRRRGRMDA